MSVTYEAVLDVSEDGVLFLSGLLNAERQRRGTWSWTEDLVRPRIGCSPRTHVLAYGATLDVPADVLLLLLRQLCDVKVINLELVDPVHELPES
jgi:hypothetical protein